MSDNEYENFDYTQIDSKVTAGRRNPSGDYQGGNISVAVRKKGEESIPDKIGKGDDAKNSVVWHVITYSLTIYSCIVASLLVIDVLRNGGESALNIVKDSWAVFTPIITLSLGYMFGKKEDDSIKQQHEGEGKK